jgi:5'-3' exonuclease
MGIKGLAGFLRHKTPRAFRPLRLEQYAGQRWGIDCSCLLYKARGAQLSLITMMAGLIVRLRSAGIEPVVVFDGRAPAAKSDVIKQRREVRQEATQEMAELRIELETREKEGDITESQRSELHSKMDKLQRRAPTINNGDRDELKRFLYAAGVLYVTADGEADDVLAMACRRGEIHAVVSNDMDMLARGIPLLVVPDTPDATVFHSIALGEVLAMLSVDYYSFVRACVYMGCDYTVRGWRTVEPRVAFQLVRGDQTVDIDETVASELDVVHNQLTGDVVVWEDVLVENQRQKWSAGAPPVEVDALTTLATTHEWPMTWLYPLSMWQIR